MRRCVCVCDNQTTAAAGLIASGEKTCVCVWVRVRVVRPGAPPEGGVTRISTPAASDMEKGEERGGLLWYADSVYFGTEGTEVSKRAKFCIPTASEELFDVPFGLVGRVAGIFVVFMR